MAAGLEKRWPRTWSQLTAHPYFFVAASILKVVKVYDGVAQHFNNCGRTAANRDGLMGRFLTFLNTWVVVLVTVLRRTRRELRLPGVHSAHSGTA
jgi:hypothetical protein